MFGSALSSERCNARSACTITSLAGGMYPEVIILSVSTLRGLWFPFPEDLSLKPVTNWVVLDFTKKDGRDLLRAALKHLV